MLGGSGFGQPCLALSQRNFAQTLSLFQPTLINTELWVKRWGREQNTHEQYNIHFPSFLQNGAHEFECLCQIRDIFADYDPHFMPMSLDEAYLDFTDHLEKRQNWPESSRTHHYRSSNSSTATGRAKHFIKSFKATYNVLCGLTVAGSVYAFCVVTIPLQSV